jgi:hypothetical protein
VTLRWAPLMLALVAGCAAHPPGGASTPAPTSPSVRAVVPQVEADPPAASGASPLEGYLATGDPRPVAQTLHFDVDTLPVATWGEAWPAAGFSLHRVVDGWSLWVRTTIFAEVILTASGSSRKQDGTLPVGFSAFTGGSFGEGQVPFCGGGLSGRRLAVWNGFAPAGWTDEGMNVEMEEGDYDLATCTGTPVHSLRGRASAVVPGYVYAVRAREEDDDGNSREELVVFLPRGALVSTAADPILPLQASNTGAFTRLTFPLAPGTAGSTTLRISPAALAMWARLRQMRGPILDFRDASVLHDDLLLGVDVVWQGDRRLGTLSFSMPKPKERRAYAGLLAAAKRAGLAGL